MRGPGFEPGSSAWKAEILTTVLPALVILIKNGVLKFFVIGELSAKRARKDLNLRPLG